MAISNYESYGLDNDYINDKIVDKSRWWRYKVNIAHAEEDYDIEAKTCGCKDKTRKVTYSFVDSYHSLCRDKKDILISEIPVKDC